MKKCFIILSIILTTLLISCGGTSGDNSQKSKVIKLSHNHANGYPVDIACNKFAEIISNKTMGRYIIEVYPSAQLGEQRASLELAKSDVIQIVFASSAILESFDSMYSVFNLPYLHKDKESYVNVMTSDGITKYYESSIDNGFITLAFIEAGARSMYTKSKPINNLSDLKGMKIRTIDSPSSIEMIKLLGASPTALNLAEIYTALQQGVIDGAENNPPSYVETGHAEVAKYYSLTEHLRMPDFIVVGAPFWKSLTDEDKQIFRDAGKEIEILFADLWQKSEDESMQKAINEYNVQIVKPDTEPFRQAVLPMHESLANKDPKAKELIDYIKNFEK